MNIDTLTKAAALKAKLDENQSNVERLQQITELLKGKVASGEHNNLFGGGDCPLCRVAQLLLQVVHSLPEQEARILFTVIVSQCLMSLEKGQNALNKEVEAL